MSGPMQMYLYVHDAILREVAELEPRAKELAWDDADEVDALADRIAWFQRMVKTHEHTEEQVLFPRLEERFRFVAEAYAFDHDDTDTSVFADMGAAFAGLRNDDRGAQRGHGERVYRQAVALHEHMRLHIAKENELLLPKLEAEFDVSEQAEIAGAMAGLVEPPVMAELIGWMYRGQTNADREGMLRFLMKVLPEGPFGAMSAMVADIDSDAWAVMTNRIPELAEARSG